MDSIAKDGTIFTNARAAYPSTWDAWLMMNSGRYLGAEMSNILSFEDRYSKHNNLRKVFHMLGTSRWAHAHAAAHADDGWAKRHEENFENEEYADISEEETKWGMYRGDRNLERVIRFIDSLKPASASSSMSTCRTRIFRGSAPARTKPRRWDTRMVLHGLKKTGLSTLKTPVLPPSDANGLANWSDNQVSERQEALRQFDDRRWGIMDRSGWSMAISTTPDTSMTQHFAFL